MMRRRLSAAVGALALVSSLSACVPAVVAGAGAAAMVGTDRRTTGSYTDDQTFEVKLAAQIAAKSPIAVTGTKAMISYMRDHTVNDGLEYVATWNAAMLQSNDLRVAIAAHMSKQKPEFVD